MNYHTSTEQQIDDETVNRYFNGGAGGGTADTVSMMAHEHNLPASAARYRLRIEALLVIGLTQCVPQGECLTLAVGRGPGPRSSPIATRLSLGSTVVA